MAKLLKIHEDYFLIKEISEFQIAKNDYIALNAGDEEYPYWEVYLAHDPKGFHGRGLYKVIASSLQPKHLVSEMAVIDFGRIKSAFVAQLARASVS